VQERPLILSGEVFSKIDSLPIPNVHIVNLQSGRATTSNSNGVFALSANETDTIRITAIGYYDGYIYLKDFDFKEEVHLNIFLQLQVYELDSTTVYSFMSKEEFKKQFLEMEPYEDSIYLNLPDLGEWSVVGGPGTGAGMTIKGPITAIYNAFSKKAKYERQYKALLVSEKRKAIAEKKYNAEFIMRITGLAGDDEVNEFMRFCNLTDQYVIAVTEYELAQAVEDCYAEYMAAK